MTAVIPSVRGESGGSRRPWLRRGSRHGVPVCRCGNALFADTPQSRGESRTDLHRAEPLALRWRRPVAGSRALARDADDAGLQVDARPAHAQCLRDPCARPDQELGQWPEEVRARVEIALHSVCDLAVRRGWCGANPCRFVDEPQLADTSDIRYLTHGELERVIRCGVPRTISGTRSGPTRLVVDWPRATGASGDHKQSWQVSDDAASSADARCGLRAIAADCHARSASRWP
jgi:hypothetical protein